MARGKHKARKANRDATARRETVAKLWDELQTQRRARIEAEAEAAAVDDLEQLAATARHEASVAAEPRSRAVQREIDQLQTLVHEAEDLDRDLVRGWRAMLDAAISAVGGGNDGASLIFSIVTGQSMQLRSSQVYPGSKATIYDAVARARRLEGTEPPVSLPRVMQRGMTRDVLQSFIPYDVDELMRDVAIGDELAGVERDEAEVTDRLCNAIVGLLDSKAVTEVSNHAREARLDSTLLWHPSPWLRHGWFTSTHPLGVVTSEEDARAWQRSRDTLGLDTISDDDWTRLADRDAAVAWEAGRSRVPTDPLPVHPRPVDAVGLRRLYAMDLQGRVLLSKDDLPLTTGWQRPLWSLADTATREVMRSVPFWLPPKQTAGFAASEPLPTDDIGDLRLPFPHTFVVCADPLVMEPTDEPADETERGQMALLGDAVRYASRTVRREVNRWDRFDRSKRKEGVSPTGALLNATRRGYWDNPLTVPRIIELFGALVEGVVVSASDRDGTVADGFVWCLAIPAPDGRAIIGRVAVPALLSQTAWHTEVTNLIAAACWGDWHQPTESPGDDPDEVLAARLTGSDPRRAAAAGADVHVLNVKVSGSQIEVSPADDGSGPDDGPRRTLRPHLRRGHYRRQHYGPRNAHVKRIRVAPVLVNASRSDLVPTVYRLPASVAHAAAGREVRAGS